MLTTLLLKTILLSNIVHTHMLTSLLLTTIPWGIVSQFARYLLTWKLAHFRFSVLPKFNSKCWSNLQINYSTNSADIRIKIKFKIPK